ncbi:uncharacterized protein si:dkey-86e18.1 [Kryptolebias marmoratus]|uniref:Si:dkey-86e18.1 n=1 Tax=Kryptolebias marmoratus TaxID=37003 RepID=A0A3Q3A4B4_KRYMA|nr:uncharacterized protein si:dkey-86e18.1 [Kryptolebias marmoratus]
MARNEEKQQGRLNRLWLQKEKEEGRIKDVNERRPKLSNLNSASSVKKWIPNIKKEIEYYLQQSQLSHYPERKIAEFQLHIEALEKEYKRFITKLRALDPSCKHKPWTPRAYCKRRADIKEDSPSAVKAPRLFELRGGGSQSIRGESESVSSSAGCLKMPATEGPCSFPETRFHPPASTCSVSVTSEEVCSVQDEPLSFDRTRLAVAAAAFRGPSVQLSSLQTQNLARMLQSGLPNLNNSPSRQKILSQSKNSESSDGVTKSSVDRQKAAVQENKSNCEPSDARTTQENSGHILGLDYYSSSDEDSNM